LASGILTYNISSNKILESRFSWSRYSQILDLNNKVNPASLGIDTGPLSPLDYGVPVVYSSLTGSIGGVAGYPLSTRPTQVYDYSTHYTWIHGAHTTKLGGSYQYGSTYSLRNRAHNTFGVYEGDWNDILTELLLGRVDYTSRSFGDTSRHLYQPSMGIFVQDEWKIRPRVTISYGLRWDVNGALGDSDKDAANFYPCAPPEPTNCAPNGNPNGLVPIGPSNPRLYGLDLRDFGPRAGLAWDVFGNGKTAIRASYAMAYDIANFAAISAPYPFNGARAGAFTNPTAGVFSVTALGNDNPTNVTTDDVLFQAYGPNTCYNPATNTGSPSWVCFGPQPGSPNPAIPFQTYGGNPTGTPPFNIFGTAPTLRTPRIQYYSLTLQHQLFKNSVLSIGYVGSHGTDLFLERSLNNLPIGCYTAAGQQTGPPMSAGNTTNLNCVHPFDSVFQTNVNGVLVPSYKYIMQLTNDGWSDYNSLQVTFRQRNW